MERTSCPDLSKPLQHVGLWPLMLPVLPDSGHEQIEDRTRFAPGGENGCNR